MSRAREPAVVGLALCLLAASLPRGVAGQTTTPTSRADDLATYTHIVDVYRRGQTYEAMRALSEFPRERAENALAELGRRARAEEGNRAALVDLVRAAVVFHTDIALSGFLELPSEQSSNLGMARTLVEIEQSGRRPDAHLLPEGFRKRWHLWVVWVAHGTLDSEMLARSLEALRDHFPAAPETFLASGSLLETLAWTRLRSMTIVPAYLVRGRTRHQLLWDAERDFRRALNASPDLDEARLRLARVLFEQERHDEALATLGPLLNASGDPWVAYLARLFAGAASEALGRVTDAIAHYGAAGGLEPALPTPHVALSHAYRRAGARSAAAAEAAAAISGDRDVDADPWWDYEFGQAHKVPALASEMRGEVRR
jgi:tetratricopeptide (TPR) repeat protein